MLAERRAWPVWWSERGDQNPIPSRTRPLTAPAPMVLCLKTRESRSPPDLPSTSHNPSTRSNDHEAARLTPGGLRRVRAPSPHGLPAPSPRRPGAGSRRRGSDEARSRPPHDTTQRPGDRGEVWATSPHTRKQRHPASRRWTKERESQSEAVQAAWAFRSGGRALRSRGFDRKPSKPAARAAASSSAWTFAVSATSRRRGRFRSLSCCRILRAVRARRGSAYGYRRGRDRTGPVRPRPPAAASPASAPSRAQITTAPRRSGPWSPEAR